MIVIQNWIIISCEENQLGSNEVIVQELKPNESKTASAVICLFFSSSFSYFWITYAWETVYGLLTANVEFVYLKPSKNIYALAIF